MSQYETVAASQSDQPLGPVGAKGDHLLRLIITAATVSAGAVSIKDGSGSAIPVYTGGAAGLGPISVHIGAHSQDGAWKVTTGAGVTVIATGDFS